MAKFKVLEAFDLPGVDGAEARNLAVGDVVELTDEEVEAHATQLDRVEEGVQADADAE